MVVAAESAQMDPKGLERVEKLFIEQVETGVHPGAALAVYRHGKPVLDLYGGLADRESGRPITADSIFVLYSSTKAVSAACLHILWERGKFDWDDTVASHWPGFAQKGKEDVTIRHVLTHQAGFPDTPSHMTWDRWHDWEAAVEAMEQIPLDYKPGRVIAYHPRNFGWVVGELVRRIDGRPIDQFVREEITGPLQIQEFHLGIDPDMEERVAKLHAMEDCDRTSQVTIYNRPEVHTAVLPAGGGIATARGLAKFYAMMAGGGTLDGVVTLKPETVAEVTKQQSEGLDHTLDRQVVRSLGLSLGDPRSATPGNESIRTFGHAGSGTSIGWANPDTGLAMAYITNGFRAEVSNTPRLAAISQAIQDAAL
ncbi:MAG: beta-lactamase family protein [SAR202 cluster bacterium]|nr:beta-lactamase family protein [SAR202 cluster bacterium]HCP24719.1 serine hydrolase [Dehalococcoidia bacterium]|tara:strand:- start:87 stop:1187 length:1101 start_codon:yes stop_codon:yes gene_type:complete